MKTTWEVADIFRLYGKDYQKKNLLSYKELKTMINKRQKNIYIKRKYWFYGQLVF